MSELQKVKLSETELTLWEVEFTLHQFYDKNDYTPEEAKKHFMSITDNLEPNDFEENIVSIVTEGAATIQLSDGTTISSKNIISFFLFFFRNQALGTGHTDNIIITIGYLPNKKTNYAFKLAGSDNLGSEYKISKNINDFEIDFKLNNQNVLKPNSIDEAMVNLKKIF